MQFVETEHLIRNREIFRVSTKWLNLLRKICAIFAQILFLRTFALFLRMKRNEFCANFFAQFAQNRKYFLRKLRIKRNFSFAQFFAQNRKYFLQKQRETKFQLCSIFLRNLSKTGYIFLRKLRMKQNFSFAQFFCTICAKPQVLRKM